MESQKVNIATLLYIIAQCGAFVCVIGIVYHSVKLIKAQKEIHRLNKLQLRIKDLQIQMLEDQYNRQIMELRRRFS